MATTTIPDPAGTATVLPHLPGLSLLPDEVWRVIPSIPTHYMSDRPWCRVASTTHLHGVPTRTFILTPTHTRKGAHVRIAGGRRRYVQDLYLETFGDPR